MSEKLSERSVKWRVDHDVLGGEVNVRAMTRKQVAAEIAALEAKLETAKRDQDELWCRALTVLDPKYIQQVTEKFLELRERVAA